MMSLYLKISGNSGVRCIIHNIRMIRKNIRKDNKNSKCIEYLYRIKIAEWIIIIVDLVILRTFSDKFLQSVFTFLNNLCSNCFTKMTTFISSLDTKTTFNLCLSKRLSVIYEYMSTTQVHSNGFNFSSLSL